MRPVFVLLALIVGCPAAAATPSISSAGQAAAFRAAGFKQEGREWVRCEGDPSSSRMPGELETADLNGDGAPEVWIRESSTYCYGQTAEAFVLLTRKNSGWAVLLDEVGVANPLSAGRGGWPEIEVGGPGAGPFPVYRYEGSRYVRTR